MAQTQNTAREFGTRLLNELVDLTRGQPLTRQGVVAQYQVDTRTYYRDMALLRAELAKKDVRMVRTREGWRLVSTQREAALVAIAHELLSSGGFVIAEKDTLLHELLAPLAENERQRIKKQLRSANAAYQPRTATAPLLPLISQLSLAIDQDKAVTFTYASTRNRQLKPNGTPHTGKPDCLFVDHDNFYVAMYQHAKKQGEKDDYFIYRLDRISAVLRVRTNQSLQPAQHFDLQKYRRDTYLMNDKTVHPIEILYRGDPRIVRDAFPHAKMGRKQADGSLLITLFAAESGVLLWVLSQGAAVMVKSPGTLRDKVVDALHATLALYDEES